MVSGKVVPLLERGEGARPEVYLKASWSWDPDSRWTDEMFKHVILWNVRGILRGKKPHLDILEVSCHTNSEFTPHGALKKNNRKYNAKNSNAYRCLTALLKREGA